MFAGLLKIVGLSNTWPTFTWEEIRNHDSADSCWIVAGDSVYDVTRLLKEHAGGASALLKRGGGAKDCTEDLHFHSRGARLDADKYKIGEVAPGPRPTEPVKKNTPASFSKAVSTRNTHVRTKSSDDLCIGTTTTPALSNSVREGPSSEEDKSTYLAGNPDVVVFGY